MTSLWLSALLIVVMCQNLNGLEKVLNKCLDGKFQKKTPGPEELYFQCSPWQNRSCCTYKTTEQIHNGDIYNFNFNHCPDLMSAQCKSRFVQDLCFYECSPNVAPWIVKDTRTWRQERFYNVPLCASDCDAWFNDCAADFTCTDNWSKNFDWSNGSECSDEECFRNSCPKESKCMTFLEIYANASNFCEKVWDNSWKYTSDSEPCMRLWFNATDENPNYAVALKYAHLVASAPNHSHDCVWLTSLLVLWRLSGAV